MDANGDGITQDGELLTLQQAGVQSMNLQAQHSDRIENGNQIALTSEYTRTDGSVYEMADVWFGSQREVPAPSPEAATEAATEAAPAAAAQGTDAALPGAATLPANPWAQAVFEWKLAAPEDPGLQPLSDDTTVSSLDLRDILGGGELGAADALQNFLASSPAADSAAVAEGTRPDTPRVAVAEVTQSSQDTELQAALSMGMGIGSSDDSALRDLLNRDKLDLGA